MNIGENIKNLRKNKGITQEQLADHLGISYQAVSKWENNANTPDILLLPEIAGFFGISIDALFYGEDSAIGAHFDMIQDDDVFRIIQMRGKKLVQVNATFSPDCPPIEIAFPRNCNDDTQYFKVEVYGHIITDSSINGDVICHQTIRCSDINGTVRCDGDVYAKDINTHANIVCSQIKDCYHLQCHRIECGGNISSVNLTATIIEKKISNES